MFSGTCEWNAATKWNLIAKLVSYWTALGDIGRAIAHTVFPTCRFLRCNVAKFFYKRAKCPLHVMQVHPKLWANLLKDTENKFMLRMIFPTMETTFS
jgi:hypothetical protein